MGAAFAPLAGIKKIWFKPSVLSVPLVKELPTSCPPLIVTFVPLANIIISWHVNGALGVLVVGSKAQREWTAAPCADEESTLRQLQQQPKSSSSWQPIARHVPPDTLEPMMLMLCANSVHTVFSKRMLRKQGAWLVRWALKQDQHILITE